MVSTMTFEKAAQIHVEYLKKVRNSSEDAQSRLLTFLNWDEPAEDKFGADARIILVSEDFSKELTTAVLWLREHDIDIRCVRLKPYLDADKLYVDVQPLIPLPEVQDYVVKVREKSIEGQKVEKERTRLRGLFWAQFVALARTKHARHGNVRSHAGSNLYAGAGRSGLSYAYTIGRDYSAVELNIASSSEDENIRVFMQLKEHQPEIEQVFGEKLNWDSHKERSSSKIRYESEEGGYRSPETEWATIQQNMLDFMTRLESALQPFVDALS
jgi:hypothetical protein